MQVEKKEKPPSWRKMFMDRMRRENRMEKYAKLYKKHIENKEATSFEHPANAQLFTMKEMGYVNAAKEREFLAIHEALEGRTKEQAEQEAREEAVRVEREIEDYEAAVASLPDSCAWKDEMDWIRSHPAMSRINRSTDPLKQVVLTANDILKSPIGPCPSQATAYALQHWANRPHEFFKLILSSQKKQQEKEEGVDEDSETETDLRELKAMLAEARS